MMTKGDSVPDREAPRSSVRLPIWIFLLALITLCDLGLQWYYIRHDGRPPTYDDAWYLENSLNLYHTLTREGPGRFLRAYTEVFRIKAPLIAVLPLPFYALHGTSLESALLANSVFLVAINVCLFAIANRWYGPGTGVLAVVIFQTLPVAIGMSRAYMTDYGLTALTVAFVYGLEKSEGLRDGPANCLVGVVGGLGLLMKITFPPVVLAPFLATWASRWGAPGNGSLRGTRFSWYSRSPVLSIALTAGLIASTWYVFNLPQVVRFSVRSAYGDIAGHYALASRWVWLRDLGNFSLSSYYALVVLALAARELWRLASGRGWEWSHRSTMLASWFWLPAVAVWLANQEDPRYALVVLPPLAIWTASRVSTLVAGPGRRTAAALWSILFVALPVLGSAALTFPTPALGNGIRVGPFLFLGRNLGWAHAPDRVGDWGQIRALQAMKSMAPGARPPSFVIVGVEHPYFNANLLGYLNARENGPFRFTSFGFDPDTPHQEALDRALNRMRELNPRFIIMAEGFPERELLAFLNRLNGEIRVKLDSGALPYRRRMEVGLTGSIRAIIYAREETAVLVPRRPQDEPFSLYARELHCHLRIGRKDNL